MSLPSGYKQFEYIQSNGNQWIDTGFNPNQNTRVVMDVDLLEYTRWCMLFGARDGTSNKEYSVAISPEMYFQSRFNTNVAKLLLSVVTGRYLIDKNKELCLLNNSKLKSTYSTFQTSYSLYLFAQNNAGVNTGRIKAKLYYCKVYDNGTLVRDFIPCQTTNGEIGLWDNVNSMFYGNVGTRKFIAGPEVPTKVPLVTDRTLSDVHDTNQKGTYNASDLNRVGAAMNYVAYWLKKAGYDPHISPKTDWQDGEWVTPESQAVYLGDLAELRRQFSMMSTTPEVPPRILATGINTNDGLTHTWANNIEKILEDVDYLLTKSMQSRFFSGDLFSGEV